MSAAIDPRAKARAFVDKPGPILYRAAYEAGKMGTGAASLNQSVDQELSEYAPLRLRPICAPASIAHIAHVLVCSTT